MLVVRLSRYYSTYNQDQLKKICIYCSRIESYFYGYLEVKVVTKIHDFV